MVTYPAIPILKIYFFVFPDGINPVGGGGRNVSGVKTLSRIFLFEGAAHPIFHPSRPTLSFLVNSRDYFIASSLHILSI